LGEGKIEAVVGRLDDGDVWAVAPESEVAAPGGMRGTKRKGVRDDVDAGGKIDTSVGGLGVVKGGLKCGGVVAGAVTRRVIGSFCYVEYR
jgi:hypothetical protein